MRFLGLFLKMFVANYVASFRRLNSKEHNSHQLFFCEHDEYGAKMCVKVEKLGHLKEAHFN